MALISICLAAPLVTVRLMSYALEPKIPNYKLYFHIVFRSLPNTVISSRI